jgi:dTDP-4-amino-4,6-dideoxygalactose transaminase
MRRREIAAGYRRRLDAAAPGVLVRQQPDRSMFFRFPISLHTGRCDNVAARFAVRGVVVRRGVDRLVHREIGLSDARFPVATELFATTISLPIYPALTDADAEVVAAAAVAVLADTRAAGAPRCVSA